MVDRGHPQWCPKNRQFWRFASRLGSKVNITFLPGSDPMDTVVVAKRLYQDGMRPVPHIAARSIRDGDQLDGLLALLVRDAAVDEVLVIGGGVDRPVGAFSSMQIWKAACCKKHGVRRVGVAAIWKEALISTMKILSMRLMPKCNSPARWTGYVWLK